MNEVFHEKVADDRQPGDRGKENLYCEIKGPPWTPMKKRAAAPHVRADAPENWMSPVRGWILPRANGHEATRATRTESALLWIQGIYFLATGSGRWCICRAFWRSPGRSTIYGWCRPWGR